MEEEAVNLSKKKKVLIRIISIFGWSLIGLLFLISGFNVIDRLTNYKLPFFGLRASVVMTPSMSMDVYGSTGDYEIKQLQVNDMVITKNTSYEDIQVGDVITYTAKEGLICHRVVEKYETEGYHFFITRGDANTAPDNPIEMDSVRGKVINVVPKVGGFVAFIQSPYMLIGVGASGFIIFGSIFIFKFTEDKKREKEDKSNN